MNDWKSFLKPDWKKVVIALVIFLIVVFVPVLCSEAINVTTGERSTSCISFFKSSVYYVKYFHIYSKESIDWLSLLIGIVVMSYLLSCTFTFVYIKFKKWLARRP